MKTYKGVEVQIPSFLISALDGGEWSASRPDRLTYKQQLTAPAAYGVVWAPWSVWTSWKSNTPSSCLDSNLGTSRPHSSLEFEGVEWFNLALIRDN
jgi:hypothetical protein